MVRFCFKKHFFFPKCTDDIACISQWCREQSLIAISFVNFEILWILNIKKNYYFERNIWKLSIIHVVGKEQIDILEENFLFVLLADRQFWVLNLVMSYSIL